MAIPFVERFVLCTLNSALRRRHQCVSQRSFETAVPRLRHTLALTLKFGVRRCFRRYSSTRSLRSPTPNLSFQLEDMLLIRLNLDNVQRG